MFEVREYHTPDGDSPFHTWFESLNREAALKASTVLAKIEAGNLGDVKPVGGGVSETRINFGPGYRIYSSRDGEKVIILLGGGTKKRQQNDIEEAKACWQDYKKQKRSEKDATD
ncbi:MAG: type II toxin-antitoxin system RelE/ParE family toxin [Pirellulales bacterium]|nr:type II toxin-antitoxin system RelE/ParE family toxin [Pirellulales bacterium]